MTRITAGFVTRVHRVGVSPASRTLVPALALSLSFAACAARAQHKLKDADCLACHSAPALTTEVNGKKVSLYVDGSKLKHSIHGGMFSCVDCHTDVKGLARHLYA